MIDPHHMHFKVIANKIGCLQGKSSHARYFLSLFFGRGTQAFLKRTSESICLTELPTFTLPRSSEQTGLYQSGDNRLINCATAHKEHQDRDVKAFFN